MMGSESNGDWGSYIEKLAKSGMFRGGSSLGRGISASKGKIVEACQITGFIHLEADSLQQARSLLAGNPLYEGGGRIEILEEVPD